jgi:nucleotide-binding universal stress UspA family protein
MNRGAILFGIADAATGRIALEWAAREARSQNRPLHVVRAFHWSSGMSPWETGTDRMAVADLRQVAEESVVRAVTHIHDAWPGLRVTGESVEGIAWEVMTERSFDAGLTVLGSRNLSIVGAAVLGSVSTMVAARAAGPVVVVRGAPGLRDENPSVVVGIDPRSANDAVLSFAFDQASRYALQLRAILCWRPNAGADVHWSTEQPAPPKAERWLAEAVAGWQEKYPDVHVHRGVVRAHAVDGLVAQGHAQELLVVGGHTKHPRLASLLGSVSQGVLHHATCPVAVVHAEGSG